ncbi:MAG: hypothetical protein ACON5A_04235 [Candidatus Comchoanobacterales bacterium]
MRKDFAYNKQNKKPWLLYLAVILGVAISLSTGYYIYRWLTTEQSQPQQEPSLDLFSHITLPPKIAQLGTGNWFVVTPKKPKISGLEPFATSQDYEFYGPYSQYYQARNQISFISAQKGLAVARFYPKTT